ncbi:hypothetical protein BURCENBC7_AP7659 [Burkholderia cenocepacia BC7]|nr:hypothetical protein BURCENK562V_C6323 [Burkholderia cenocepacia K56-2Valvano]ERI27267.1 hypothetical protein BURCENBC7_AP7659 [Burkholderia cenocepacia BC7]
MLIHGKAHGRGNSIDWRSRARGAPCAHALPRPGESGRDGTTLHQPVFQVQPSGDGAGSAWIVPGAWADGGRAVRNSPAAVLRPARRPELCRDPARP